MSASRPTVGADVLRTASWADDATRARTTGQAGTGWDLPLRSSRRGSLSSNACSPASAAPAPSRTVPGAAADCRRAAVLTTSPLTRHDGSPAPPVGTGTDAITSPHSTPTRTRSASGARPRAVATSLTPATMSMPARIARTASSSLARGSPKTASTASPMYFSTQPAWSSSAAPTRAK